MRCPAVHVAALMRTFCVVDGEGDGGQVLEERDGFGGVTARYVYGGYIDEPLLMQRDTDGDGTLDGTFYYLQDDNYNVTALADTAGNVVERYAYGDFGMPTFLDGAGAPVLDVYGDFVNESQYSNPYLFTGRRWEPDLGLYDYRTRFMDPQQGRFITRDTIGLWGDANNLGNPYAYCGNNPWSRLDPWGEGPQDRVSAWLYDKLIGEGNWLSDAYRDKDGFEHKTAEGLATSVVNRLMDPVTWHGPIISGANEGMQGVQGVYVLAQEQGAWGVAEAYAPNAAHLFITGHYTSRESRRAFAELGYQGMLAFSGYKTSGANYGGRLKDWYKRKFRKPAGVDPPSLPKAYEPIPSSNQLELKLYDDVDIPQMKNNVHGNSLESTKPTTLYERYDAKGRFEKWGITDDLTGRYTLKELDGGYLEPRITGSRRDMFNMERYLTERFPGPKNYERWAGSKPIDAPR